MILSYKIVAYLIIALGVAHQIFALGNDNFSLNVLWFVGSGLAIIFAGFLNLAFLQIEPKNSFVRTLCVVANLTVTILFTVAFLTVLREPQVLAGVALFALAAVFSIVLRSE